MAEVPIASFVMHGARDAMADGLAHIEEHVKGIERAIVENPGLAFDLSKTLIESTCKGILQELSVAYSDDDSLPALFKSTTQQLSFLPPSESGESTVRKSLDKTLSGLSTTIQGICELRNLCGFASHGSGSSRPVMEATQAQLAAEAADSIVGFLHRVHRQSYAMQTATKLTYDDKSNEVFNESLDEDFGLFRIHEMEFRPSEVLFTLEPESYRIYLADFQVNDNSVVDDSAGGEVQS